MPESSQHLQLLQRILEFIRDHFREHYSLSVLNDLPSAIGGERPPNIGGFVPDVYATDVPITTTIIGEAKTAKDLETEHTKRQITAFGNYLCARSNGVFILAVPWRIFGAAQRVVQHTLPSLSEFNQDIRVIILDETREITVNAIKTPPRG
jgi:hypothetical protein